MNHELKQKLQKTEEALEKADNEAEGPSNQHKVQDAEDLTTDCVAFSIRHTV